MEVAGLIIGCIALAGSIVSPLIMATALFINRIKDSECCGSQIHLTETQPAQLQQQQTVPQETIDAIRKSLENNVLHKI